MVKGNRTPTAAGQAIDLVFQVKSGGRACGAGMIGLAQERLTNLTNAHGQPLPDTGWMPPSASPTFYLLYGQISDQHWQTNDPQTWNAVAVNGALATATQELRIVWTDPCSLTHEHLLGSRTIVHRKVSNSAWQIEVN